MVVICCKSGDAEQFLFECSASDSADAVTRELCLIANARARIACLASACEALLEHGPATADDRSAAGGSGGGDAAHRLHLAPPAPPAAELIRRTLADAVALAASAQVAAGVALTAASLHGALDSVRGAVGAAYPADAAPLGAGEPVRRLLDDDDGAAAADSQLRALAPAAYHDPETTTLWWAGKEIFRDQTIGERIGRNEKTKVVARLQRRGSGPPVREPAVSEAERGAMLAHHFARAEAERALAEDTDDSHLAASAWADPRALKRELLGTTSIGWRGGRGGGVRR